MFYFEKGVEVRSQPILGYWLDRWFWYVHLPFESVPGFGWLCDAYCIFSMNVNNDWFAWRIDSTMSYGEYEGQVA